MPHKLTLLLVAILLIGCDRDGRSLATGNAVTFAPGQIWTYSTRPGEEPSRIVICRVETDPKYGQIVHIHVNGVRLKNKHAPAGFTDQVGHMPYDGNALRKSVGKIESMSTTLPPFEDGYAEWRVAFDRGKAGVWTAPLPDAIAGMEAASTSKLRRLMEG